MKANVVIKKKRRTLKLFRDLLLFVSGGVGYYSLEVAFRGYSHWSMALCGGICLYLIYHMNRKLAKKKLAVRALGGAFIITAVELVCGCVVNLALGLGVWDYSHIPLNLFGQICLPFTLLWFLLCIPICVCCSIIGGKRSTQN